MTRPPGKSVEHCETMNFIPSCQSLVYLLCVDMLQIVSLLSVYHSNPAYYQASPQSKIIFVTFCKDQNKNQSQRYSVFRRPVGSIRYPSPVSLSPHLGQWVSSLPRLASPPALQDLHKRRRSDVRTYLVVNRIRHNV